MALALLNAWKVRGDWRPNLFEIFFKCFVPTESVCGKIMEGLGMTNKDSLFSAGNRRIILLIALMGHKGETPRLGSGIVPDCFLS